MNVSDEEVPPETEPEAKDSFSEALEELRKFFAQQAAEWRERERSVTPLQQEHLDRLRTWRRRLAEEAEAYFAKQAAADEAEPEGEPMNDEYNEFVG